MKIPHDHSWPVPVFIDLGIYPHGHYLHICAIGGCKFAGAGVCHIEPHPLPDLSIRIERTGGGAAPIGFCAMMYPDELHAIPLMEWEYDGEHPVEDWKEESCFERAYATLVMEAYLKLWEDASIAHKAINDEYLKPGHNWMRVAFLHDIEDVCLAIDTTSMLH